MHGFGRRAKRVLETARADVAELIGALPEEIFFTGSGTESDNLAILGAARANSQHGNHIIVSAIEHKAILEPAKQLAEEGFEVTKLPVNRHGIVKASDLMRLMRDDTILVSIMYANNEIGTIEPIAELARAVKTRAGSGFKPIFHTDACQAAGSLTLDVDKLGVDLMSLNGSKIYGPKGIGVLYKRTNINLDPIVVGGSQENGLRAGTENVPAAVGFAKALQIVQQRRLAESIRLIKLRDYFITNLIQAVPQAILNGPPAKRLSNNVHVSIPNVEGESMLLMLDQFGIAASTGSACAATDLQPSHVLLAIGQSPEVAHGSLRFSLGNDTTKAEIDHVLMVFPGIVNTLTSISALTAHSYVNR
jgi:cysteine desulfurase